MRMVAALWEPLSDWRLSLVWRLYGWAGLQQALLLGGALSWSQWFGITPFSVHAMTVCSLLLMLFGARPALLLATSASASVVFWLTATGGHPALDFPGAEQPLFFTMPTVTVLLWVTTWRRGDRSAELSRAALGAYRIVFLVEFGMAALHKLNRDFFDPALSCAGVLREMVPLWWDSSLAGAAVALTPPVVVGVEALCAVLAFLYWPAGLRLTLVFLAGLGSVGPTGFAAVSLAAGFSFVRGTTAAEFYRPMIRWPWSLALGVGGVAAYVAWVHRAPVQHGWPQFALYGAVIVLLGVLVLHQFVLDLLRADRRVLARRLRLTWPHGRSSRVVLGALLLVWIVNGLTPYLGYKYHFSFAMLSNLRTDSMRWNSYVVPAGTSLRESDPFVEVTRLRIRRGGAPELDADRSLSTGHWAPHEFVRRVKRHLVAGHEIHAAIVYRGESRLLGRIGQNPEALAYLDALPRAPLFQKGVTPGPQPCVH